MLKNFKIRVERNPIARFLRRFTSKQFKDKTKYDRKNYVWKRNITQD